MIRQLKTRALAFALVLFLMAGLAAPLALAADFGDTSGHWAENVINKWSDYGILMGDGIGFRPDGPITRGEFATIVNRIAQYKKVGTTVFTDLDPTDIHADALLKLNAAGIINGVGEGKIDPHGTVPRQQAIAILARVFSVAPDAAGLARFKDASDVTEWAKAEVGGMALAGYVQGDDGKLDPLGSLTRAQAVQMFENIIKALYYTPGTYTIETDGIVVVNVPNVELKDSKIGTLYITQGVGTGDFTLTDSVVGKIIADGGGDNSIHIKNSTVGKLTFERPANAVRVHIDKDSTVNGTEIADTATETIRITGDVETIEAAANSTVIIEGNIGSVTIIGDNVTIIVASGATVESVTVEGDGAKLNVQGTVKDVTIEADNASVEGSGKVENVDVKSGDGNSVKTNGSKVTVSEEAGDVTTGNGGKIESGTEADSKPDTNTGGGYTPSGPTLATPVGNKNTVTTAVTGTADAQEIIVTGYINYADNEFTGTVKSDLSGTGWDLLATGSNPDPAIAGGLFTALSITNFKSLLSQAGITAGSEFTIVQTNSALLLYNDGLYPGGVKTKKYDYDALVGNEFNLLLQPTNLVKIEVYKGDATVDLVLTIDIDATALQIGATGETAYTFTQGSYYKITDGGGATRYFVKADGTQAANIGQIGAIETTGTYFLPYISGDVRVEAVGYVEGTHGAIDYDKHSGNGQAGVISFNAVTHTLSIDSAYATATTGEVNLTAFFTAARLGALTGSTFQYAILGRTGTVANVPGGGSTITTGPFYAAKLEYTAGPPETYVGNMYGTNASVNDTGFPSFVGVYNITLSDITQFVTIYAGDTQDQVRTYIFDCDDGNGFVFLNTVVVASI